jgi:hypothetical protein
MDASFPTAVSFDVSPIDTDSGVVYAAIVLLGLYVLIVLEVSCSVEYQSGRTHIAYASCSHAEQCRVHVQSGRGRKHEQWYKDRGTRCSCRSERLCVCVGVCVCVWVCVGGCGCVCVCGGVWVWVCVGVCVWVCVGGGVGGGVGVWVCVCVCVCVTELAPTVMPKSGSVYFVCMCLCVCVRMYVFLCRNCLPSLSFFNCIIDCFFSSPSQKKDAPNPVETPITIDQTLSFS